METEVIEENEMEIIESSVALQALNSSEIDIQVTTAHKFPRSIKAFKHKALEQATIDEATAQSMFYALPRSGKLIEGPSVRLAEIVASSWGNLRAESQVISIDDKFITAMGTCMDLESNYAVRVQVKSRITTKNGKKYNDDMIQVAGMAACSKAYRNAVFKVVPIAHVNSILEAAKKTAIGTEKTLSQRRDLAIDWFKKNGAEEKQVLNMLGRNGVEEITLDDLATLRGVITAIKDGDTTLKTALEGGLESTNLNEKLLASPIESTPEASDRAKELLKATEETPVVY